MSRAIAMTILRTVSAWAASPYVTLSSLGHAVDEHRDLVTEVVAQARRGRMPCPRPCRAAAPPRGWAASCRASARIVVTASGCVMYASPLLRIWPSWALSATA